MTLTTTKLQNKNKKKKIDSRDYVFHFFYSDLGRMELLVQDVNDYYNFPYNNHNTNHTNTHITNKTLTDYSRYGYDICVFLFLLTSFNSITVTFAKIIFESNNFKILECIMNILKKGLKVNLKRKTNICVKFSSIFTNSQMET